jgi:hypothetical protein
MSIWWTGSGSRLKSNETKLKIYGKTSVPAKNKSKL